MLIIIIKFLPCNIQFQAHYLWLQSGEELSGQFMVCMLWLSFNLPVQFVPLHLCSLHTSSFWLSVFEMGMTCIHYGSLGYSRTWMSPACRWPQLCFSYHYQEIYTSAKKKKKWCFSHSYSITMCRSHCRILGLQPYWLQNTLK